MKVTVTVTHVQESLDSKGTVTVSANLDPTAWSLLSTLKVKAPKGQYEVGDKIELTIKKVEK